MGEENNRYIDDADWEETPVTITPFLNGLCTPTGFKRKDGTIGNPLLPACIFEDVLIETFREIKREFPDLLLQRIHIKMPYIDSTTDRIPEIYKIIERPSNLKSTSATLALVPKKRDNPELEYGYNRSELCSLKERLKDKNFNGLIGNLGYYMTENLVEGVLDWTHNKRYSKEFHLKTIKSYLGFYLRKNRNGGITSSFAGGHPAAVAIDSNGKIQVIPEIKIGKYLVKINNVEFSVDNINLEKISNEDVILFNPGFRTGEVNKNIENWKKYAPTVPHVSHKRVNLFISNEGNGKYPEERVVEIWTQGRAPIPSFGAVLSLKKEHYETLFGDDNLINKNVEIIPYGNLDFESYSQIFGGLIPAVIEGNHLYDVNTSSELIYNLDKFGNAVSPITQAGRETNNFSYYIREPAGVFIETENKVGWVMFDGRHELSIGASISDIGKILKKLECENYFHEKIKNAVFIDGGSAMKAYAVLKTDSHKSNLRLLNRAAAGARNGPGDDPDGLNFYSTLKIPM